MRLLRRKKPLLWVIVWYQAGPMAWLGAWATEAPDRLTAARRTEAWWLASENERRTAVDDAERWIAAWKDRYDTRWDAASDEERCTMLASRHHVIAARSMPGQPELFRNDPVIAVDLMRVDPGWRHVINLRIEELHSLQQRTRTMIEGGYFGLGSIFEQIERWSAEDRVLSRTPLNVVFLREEASK